MRYICFQRDPDKIQLVLPHYIKLYNITDFSYCVKATDSEFSHKIFPIMQGWYKIQKSSHIIYHLCKQNDKNDIFLPCQKIIWQRLTNSRQEKKINKSRIPENFLNSIRAPRKITTNIRINSGRLNIHNNASKIQNLLQNYHVQDSVVLKW